MTEHDDSSPAEPQDHRHAEDVPTESVSLGGDPSLELFGHGWTPTESHTTSTNVYTGRHRAPEP